MATIDPHMVPSLVPEHEIDMAFVRSSGPGGQNVNKTSTKAQLRWNVGASQAFTDDQKSAIRAFAGGRLTDADEIVLASDAERSQPQNKAEVIRRLQQLVAAALAPKKARKPTKVSKSQKRRRLHDKRAVSEKKSSRRPPSDD
ncbi:MAG TPA: alternative ribosome rescue aminoacyl-tRNA hydrolase ArfB [Candidatus Eisenbacteria bacterium]|jgi:ribosome-associated protein|nr:alternative ribosome rescue aminoacyl-tRNA hydrolase ArfB [Candidatus Eisenbacteria bacterium]